MPEKTPTWSAPSYTQTRYAKGPKPKAPGGYGYIDKAGYRRIWLQDEQRYTPEHIYVWEHENGPVPDGFEVHHRDENKLHNLPGNLEALPKRDHRFKHAGYELTASGWWLKPCSTCKVKLPVEECFYWQEKVQHFAASCKLCCGKQRTIDKRKAKARA